MPADFRPCDERLGPSPHDLAREPQGRERQHIRREHANRERVVARDRAEELGHDERRRVEDEHVADARQDEGRHRNPGTPCDLSAVTTQHEPERLVQASGVTAIGGGRHYSVLKSKRAITSVGDGPCEVGSSETGYITWKHVGAHGRDRPTRSKTSTCG